MVNKGPALCCEFGDSVGRWEQWAWWQIRLFISTRVWVSALFSHPIIPFPMLSTNCIFVSLCRHVYVFACLAKIISIDLSALRLMMTPREIISNTVQGFKLSSLADFLRLGETQSSSCSTCVFLLHLVYPSCRRVGSRVYPGQVPSLLQG